MTTEQIFHGTPWEVTPKSSTFSTRLFRLSCFASGTACPLRTQNTGLWTRPAVTDTVGWRYVPEQLTTGDEAPEADLHAQDNSPAAYNLRRIHKGSNSGNPDDTELRAEPLGTPPKHAANTPTAEALLQFRRLHIDAHVHVQAFEGKWSACSSDCVRTRPVMCTTLDLQVVPSELCGDELPRSSESCYTDQCTVPPPRADGNGGHGGESSGKSEENTKMEEDHRKKRSGSRGVGGEEGVGIGNGKAGEGGEAKVDLGRKKKGQPTPYEGAMSTRTAHEYAPSGVLSHEQEEKGASVSVASGDEETAGKKERGVAEEQPSGGVGVGGGAAMEHDYRSAVAGSASPPSSTTTTAAGAAAAAETKETTPRTTGGRSATNGFPEQSRTGPQKGAPDDGAPMSTRGKAPGPKEGQGEDKRTPGVPDGRSAGRRSGASWRNAGSDAGNVVAPSERSGADDGRGESKEDVRSGEEKV